MRKKRKKPGPKKKAGTKKKSGPKKKPGPKKRKQDEILPKYFIKALELETAVNASPRHLADLSTRGRFPPRRGPSQNKGYDLLEVLKYYWENIHGHDVDLEIKKQKQLKLEIENKARMGEFIKRQEVEDRNVMLLKAVKRMFLYTIKNASTMMVGCPHAREAEKILSDRFKEIFKMLDEESEKLNWSKDKSIKGIEYEMA
jgi:hypothetical protein